MSQNCLIASRTNSLSTCCALSRDADSSASSSPLPELQDEDSFTSASLSTAAYLQLSSSDSDLRGTKQLLLRAKAALLRLAESASSGIPDARRMLDGTVASIDGCLEGEGVADCCRLVREALRKLDGGTEDSSAFSEDATKDDATAVDEDPLQRDDETDDRASSQQLRSWTPAAGSRDSATGEGAISHPDDVSSLLPSELLEQFDRCGRRWIQRLVSRASAQPSSGVRPHVPTGSSTDAKAALVCRFGAARAAARKPRQQSPARRHLVVRPAPSMFGRLLRGRRICPGHNQHQQHQHQQQVTTVRTLMCSTSSSSGAAAGYGLQQQQEQRQPRPLHRSRQRPVGANGVRVMAVVLHKDGRPHGHQTEIALL